MSLKISEETEARLTDEARRHGISVDALLARLIDKHSDVTLETGRPSELELPILHMGPVGPLHRQDIYDDVC